MKKESLTAVADRIGLAYDTLNYVEIDRLMLAQTLHPEWPRETKVKFTRCGTPRIEFPPPQQPNFFTRIIEMTTTRPSTAADDDAWRQLNLRRLKLQLGFDRAALLQSHEVIFGKLADALPIRNSHSRPLYTCTTANLGVVRSLVEELPATREVVEWLAATKDGLILHTI